MSNPRWPIDVFPVDLSRAVPDSLTQIGGGVTVNRPSLQTLPTAVNVTQAELDAAIAVLEAMIAGKVSLVGDETILGIKTFQSIPVGPNTDPTTPNQFTRKAYVDALDVLNVKVVGDQVIDGIKLFSSIPVGPDADPVDDDQFARKKYVDDVAGGGGGGGGFEGLESIAELRALTSAYTQSVAFVKSYYADLGKGGNLFWHDPASGDADDDFTVFVDADSRRWKPLVNGGFLDAFAAGAKGDHPTTDDAAAISRLFLKSMALGQEMRLPAASYLVGTAITPVSDANGAQGPIIVGDEAAASWIVRKDTLTGALLGQSGDTKTTFLRNIRLENIRFGPEDSSVFLGTTPTIKLSAQRGLFRNLTLWEKFGIGIQGQYENFRFEGINIYTEHVSDGAGIRINGGKNVHVVNCPHINAADDGVQINIGPDFRLFPDPTDELLARNGSTTGYYGANDEISRNINIVNVGSFARGGSCYAVLNGSRNANIAYAFIQRIKATAVGATTAVVRLPNSNLSVGKSFRITGASGADSALYNNNTFVIQAVATNGKDFTINLGAPATTTNNQAGSSAAGQFVKVSTTSGSNVITVFMPNHGFLPTYAGYIRLTGWGSTGGLSDANFTNNRQITYVDPDTFTFTTSSGNASSNFALNFAPTTLAIALLQIGVSQDVNIVNVYGTGGDEAYNGSGGNSRKLFNTEAANKSTVNITNSEVKSLDTQENAHTRMLATAAGMRVKFVNDRILTPRSVAIYGESVYSSGSPQTVLFPFHADSLIDMLDSYVEAPSQATSISTVIADGGTFRAVNCDFYINSAAEGLVFGGGRAGYNFSYQGDPRNVTGAGMVMERVELIGCRFFGIGNGKHALDFGNVKSGLVSGCQFIPASGATTWKIAALRTAGGGDIGSTNIVFANNDYGGLAATARFTNWQINKGNVAVIGGTWTPVLTFATPGNLNVVYNTQEGYWFRNEEGIYTCFFTIITSTFTHTSASGQLRITGLPASSAVNVGGAGMEWQGVTKANYTQLAPKANVGQSYVTIIASGSGQNSQALATGDLPTGGSVILKGMIQFVE